MKFTALMLVVLLGVAIALSPVGSFTATLNLPQTPRAGSVVVSVDVTNRTNKDVTLSLPRDSRQFCAAAPHVRVLRIGTREVVYPPANTGRMCTMDMVSTVLKAGGTTRMERTLTLPNGQYVVEAWVPGVNGNTVRAPYRLLRVR